MGSSNLIALGLALLFGLRHAADPDHLIAVSTLVATDSRRARRGAIRVAGWWGAGHALAIVAVGLPIVLAGALLPELLQRLAEFAIGLIIMALAVRLLVRWRSGSYHLHTHEHDHVRHTHLHAHGQSTSHAHRHPTPRTPLQAFAIGVVHGVGGSAAVTLLLLASISGRTAAVAALFVFAAGTAVSMAALSGGAAWLLNLTRIGRSRPVVAFPLGVSALAFGALYAGAAWLPVIPLV